jgi:hypothetical protein
MAQDKTNIFKLSAEEQENYQADPFFDCMPGAEDFAKALEKDILTKETPYVLLLEKNYGMGKTFFSTRLAQYLRNNKLEAIYFSAWENDYLPDPFLSFSKELIGYFNKKITQSAESAQKTEIFTELAETKSNVENFVNILIKFAKSSSLSLPIVKTDIDKIFKEFKQDLDPVQEFKQQFSEFVQKLENQKLVLIVDELDRCRPDYAMKVLEIIKHFFDTEGLFVIIPSNQQALDMSLEALYGIKKGQSSICENYFEKFFNKTQEIPEPDYKKVVKNSIKPKHLYEAIKSGHIVEIDDKFNSFNTLIESLSLYGNKAKLSLREMNHVCKEIVHICNHFYEDIRLEYLAYLICLNEGKKKVNKQGNPLLIALNKDHPYFQSISYGQFDQNTETSKLKLLNLRNYVAMISSIPRNNDSSYYGLNEFRYDFERQYRSSNLVNLNSYQEIDSFINDQKDLINNINIPNGTRTYMDDATQHKANLMNTLTGLEQEIKNYQEKYGSDDNDTTRQAIYKEIVEKPETIYQLTTA